MRFIEGFCHPVNTFTGLMNQQQRFFLRKG